MLDKSGQISPKATSKEGGGGGVDGEGGRGREGGVGGEVGGEVVRIPTTE